MNKNDIVAKFEFVLLEKKKRKCSRDDFLVFVQMFFAVFPHLQSVGNRGKTKQEAKCNAIIAFLAHLEKRRQVGLFVPYLVKNDEKNVEKNIEYSSFRRQISFVSFKEKFERLKFRFQVEFSIKTTLFSTFDVFRHEFK